MITMDKEIVLTEQTRKKEDTIATIKLQKSIQDTLDSRTGSIVLGYRNNSLYYAIPNNMKWEIFRKIQWSDGQKLFQIRNGELEADSLDVYEGYIALRDGKNTFFYSLQNGAEKVFKFDKRILSVKKTQNENTKIITSEMGVYMYATNDDTFRENPLYDDCIQLTSGEIVALVKKTSSHKQSLLSLMDIANDQVFLIGTDTRERKILFATPKNGKILRYVEGKILFVDEEWWIFVVENVQ